MHLYVYICCVQHMLAHLKRNEWTEWQAAEKYVQNTSIGKTTIAIAAICVD